MDFDSYDEPEGRTAADTPWLAAVSELLVEECSTEGQKDETWWVEEELLTDRVLDDLREIVESLEWDDDDE